MNSHQIISFFNHENNQTTKEEEPWYVKKYGKEFIEGMRKLYSEQDIENLLKTAYVPVVRTPIKVDQKHDVIYFSADTDTMFSQPKVQKEQKISLSPRECNPPTKESNTSEEDDLQQLTATNGNLFL